MLQTHWMNKPFGRSMDKSHVMSQSEQMHEDISLSGVQRQTIETWIKAMLALKTRETKWSAVLRWPPSLSDMN